jgi:GT2 family glycosyltransferase
MVDTSTSRKIEWPTVTVVFLVYNRREELRESLRRMLFESDYPRERVDVIVVDNASTDGSGEMAREEFPQVEVISHARNVGVSGWNAGFAAAKGEWVLALDDDCYLQRDGLRRAVTAAEGHSADLVSFRVVSTHDRDYAFTEIMNRTGLLMYWGCAVLIRGVVLEDLEGYDPEIFVWANELEFTMRLFDHGYRHLHFPEVTAEHMKAPPQPGDALDWRPYRVNFRHWGYIAAKLLRRRDAAETLVALLAQNVRNALREDPLMIRGVADALRGFAHGLRHREPLRNPEVSRFYRRNFESFASPWWRSRSPRELLRALPREIVRGAVHRDNRPKGVGRWDEFYAERSHSYPEEPAVLDFWRP